MVRKILASDPAAAQDKICSRCGRTMQWRAKWRNNWHEVKYCSDACRRSADPLAQKLEEVLLAVAQKRGETATFCPSEATRLVFGEQKDWPQDAMERTRQAARRLIAQGKLEMLQKNQIVDPSRAKGPIRLRQMTQLLAPERVRRGHKAP